MSEELEERITRLEQQVASLVAWRDAQEQAEVERLAGEEQRAEFEDWVEARSEERRQKQERWDRERQAELERRIADAERRSWDAEDKVRKLERQSRYYTQYGR